MQRCMENDNQLCSMMVQYDDKDIIHECDNK